MVAEVESAAPVAVNLIERHRWFRVPVMAK